MSDCSSSEALTRDLQIAGDVSLQLRIEPLLVFIEEKNKNLRLSILFDVPVDLLLPSFHVALGSDESGLFEFKSKSFTGFLNK